MGRRVEHFRIAWKIATQHDEEIEGLIGNIMSHGAMQAIEPDAFLEVFIGGLMNLFLEKRKSLFAVSVLSQSETALTINATSRRHRTFRRILPVGTRSQHDNRGQK
jgi:hypothetical protein